MAVFSFLFTEFRKYLMTSSACKFDSHIYATDTQRTYQDFCCALVRWAFHTLGLNVENV
jgi:hypothetical protein